MSCHDFSNYGKSLYLIILIHSFIHSLIHSFKFHLSIHYLVRTYSIKINLLCWAEFDNCHSSAALMLLFLQIFQLEISSGRVPFQEFEVPYMFMEYLANNSPPSPPSLYSRAFIDFVSVWWVERFSTLTNVYCNNMQMVHFSWCGSFHLLFWDNLFYCWTSFLI